MKRILILEDEENLCSLYRQILTDEGYEVLVATDGDSALSILSQKPCDLAIVDIKLGHANGLDYMGEMLTLQRNMKIIVNSAYSVYKQDLRVWSADAYLLKSSNYDELVATVKNLLTPEETQKNDR